ncbi:hypothetical protein SPRG_03726 [Saprolegnia parasitica CBS 223.65]|uniref:F-box domain-containing protein n=1 Tax=Saprolegnia parasitica (strain CBS 223.65) TaxID=695850 RepID=A0A067CZ69_SAPPC|nr:hypothetical protein SPRG_03726 [Saprolegnia parasitica CBS 223.65]KDO31806.1 hypothetical protein SPRG_03726 [Saprolegnia parasitica CBS 223.65]|eukprot:XP_012197686.1 hypothetical protein SPRG_03726 [Saprolegnia parasitica CBS 223.65]
MLPPRCLLAPELLEAIAVFVASPLELFALLEALPHDALSSPLASLRALHEATTSHVFTYAKYDEVYFNGISLWPTLALPRAIEDPSILRHIEEALELFPVLSHESLAFPLPFALGHRTKLHVPNVYFPAVLDKALAHHRDDIGSIGLFITDRRSRSAHADGGLVQRLASLSDLPSLRDLAVHIQWHASSMTDELEAVLVALMTAPVTSLTLDVALDDTTWPPALLTAFTAWLETHALLNSVTLTQLTLPTAGIEAVCDALWASRSLRAVGLHDPRIVAAVSFLRRPLPPSWTRLDASLCEYADGSALVALLANASLAHLALSFADARYAIDVGRELVLETLPTLTCLRHLKLTSVPLLPDVSTALAAILPRLRGLCLEQNMLENAGAIALSAQLPHCKRLQSLTLRRQNFSNNGCVALADGTARCPSIECVDVADNHVGLAGAVAWSRLLPRLTLLDLSGCHVPRKGAEAFARILPHTTYLTKLVLDNNPIQRRGVQAIVKAVASTPHRKAVVRLAEIIDFDDEALCVAPVAGTPHEAWLEFY